MRGILLLFCLLIVSGLGCKKASDWLNTPRSKKDIVFNTLKDYQDLLNNTAVFNLAMPVISQVGTDNLYINEKNMSSIPIVERNAYLWNKDIFEGRASADYTLAYLAINYANTVLYGIEKIGINSNNASEYNFIKGQAHFFRAYMYFELASIFCKPYVAASAQIDKGLCLKTIPDLNAIVKRSSVYETYQLILKDIITAIDLLPVNSKIATQPSKNSAYLLLSRIYLNMSDFENAKKYSDSCLAISDKLIDFNVVPNINLPNRFPDYKTGNAEVLFYAQGNLYLTIMPNDNVSLSLVDTVLYRSYDEADFRKKYFYKEIDSVTVKYKGSYTGLSSNFCGLSTNEAFFIRAECNSRLNNLEDACRDLNVILRARYRKGSYVDYYSTDKEAVLLKVLNERRKEFPFTGNIRWQDLRRNNLDPRLATFIMRKIAGDVKVLTPNDMKYVFPFPPNEILLAGLEQNER